MGKRPTSRPAPATPQVPPIGGSYLRTRGGDLVIRAHPPADAPVDVPAPETPAEPPAEATTPEET